MYSLLVEGKYYTISLKGGSTKRGYYINYANTSEGVFIKFRWKDKEKGQDIIIDQSQIHYIEEVEKI